MTYLRVTTLLARLSKREKLFFYGAAAVVAATLLDYSLLSPILSKIEQLDQDINIQEETIKRSLSILSQEERIKDEIKKYAPYLSDLQSEEKEKIAFSQKIEALAKESFVYLIGIRPAGQSEEGISRQYFLDVEFEAQMEQVFAFFYAIENSRELFKIEKYHIRPKTDELSVVICSMSISKVIVPR